MVYIYGLVDPRDGKIKYVGKTIGPERRLKEHLRKAKRRATPKQNWLYKLMSLGLKPEMTTLEKCIEDIWEQREQYWIAFYGSQLKNLSFGGDGARAGVSAQDAHDILFAYASESVSTQELADRHGVSYTHIRDILHGVAWSDVYNMADRTILDTINSKLKGSIGDKHHQSKLSCSIVSRARQQYRSGNYSIEDLASQFDVSAIAMRNALLGKTWNAVRLPITKKEHEEIKKKTKSRAQRGERSGMSKITAADVEEIRRLCDLGNHTQVDIAKKFSVSTYTISNVKLRKTWKHI